MLLDKDDSEIEKEIRMLLIEFDVPPDSREMIVTTLKSYVTQLINFHEVNDPRSKYRSLLHGVIDGVVSLEGAVDRILANEFAVRIEELESLNNQRRTKLVGSQLFPNAPKMEVYEVPIYLIWNRIAELRRINQSKERIAELEREEQ